MRELREERTATAQALRALGMRAILFEDLGGRDENAESAYLAGVDEAQFYIGIVGDRYGTMQASGRSPTHDEYRRARNLGRRISVWVQADGSERQGDARDFVEEVRVFHTTGSFSNLDEDPLDGVNLEALPPATVEAVAQLLLVEHLVGGRRASRVDVCELGPVHRGRRRLRLGYTEPQHYSNETPGQRQIEGVLGS